MTHTLSTAESVGEDLRVGASAPQNGAGLVSTRHHMADAVISVPAEVHDLLARAAEAEGMSLRTYLTRLADSLRTPEERAGRAAEARAVLRAWNGYDPSDEELTEHRADLDRRIALAKAGR